MIKITEYKQMIADMIADINKNLTDQKVNTSLLLAADETSFCKKLKDIDGIVIGGQYPALDVKKANEDNLNPSHPCLLFILEKKDPSTMTDAQIDDLYERIGSIANELMLCIASNEYACVSSFPMCFGGDFHLEWEYNYSGFYGCSISFNLK